MKTIAQKLFNKLKRQGYFETAEYYYAQFKKQGLTDEEIAESCVLPQKLTSAQKAKEHKQLGEYIRKKSMEMTEEEKNHIKMLGEKYKKEDLEQK